MIKSDSEIAYARRAAALADDAWHTAIPLIKPGALDGDILAAMHSTIFCRSALDMSSSSEYMMKALNLSLIKSRL